MEQQPPSDENQSGEKDIFEQIGIPADQIVGRVEPGHEGAVRRTNLEVDIETLRAEQKYIAGLIKEARETNQPTEDLRERFKHVTDASLAAEADYFDEQNRGN